MDTKGKRNDYSACLYEFLGTAILLFAIQVISTTPSSDPLGIPLALFIAIAIGGSKSGAHYNPAVTIS